MMMHADVFGLSDLLRWPLIALAAQHPLNDSPRDRCNNQHHWKCDQPRGRPSAHPEAEQAIDPTGRTQGRDAGNDAGHQTGQDEAEGYVFKSGGDHVDLSLGIEAISLSASSRMLFASSRANLRSS